MEEDSSRKRTISENSSSSSSEKRVFRLSITSNNGSTSMLMDSPNPPPETSASSSIPDADEESRQSSDDDSLDSNYDDPPVGHDRMNNDLARSSGSDHDLFGTILSRLVDADAEPSTLLPELTELCNLLSFQQESVISNLNLNSLAPVLVALAKHEASASVVLLAVRAMSYLCDSLPESSLFFVQSDAVPVLCAKLMAIEYVDVAEECIQALEKISYYNPRTCLEAGVIMAVLAYIDFFSPSIQSTALDAVANMCKKVHSGCPSQFMDAVPVLCNFLQYEDQKLVEKSATCIIRMVKQLSDSSEMLDEFCKHGVVHQAARLIALNSGIALSQSIYNDLIELLHRLASVSVAAVRTLVELNISCTMKHILSSIDLSYSAYSDLSGDLRTNKILEVLKLLNELLPPLPRSNNDSQLASEKKVFMTDHPEFMLQLGTDILPLLFQVASGANLSVCHGCLTLINKLFLFSGSDVLLNLLDYTKVTSYLAGMFSRKDPHVLMLALRIVEVFLEKLPISLNALIKEGVVHAIDAILKPEITTSTKISSNSRQKLDTISVYRCLCYSNNIDSAPSSEVGSCKVEEDIYTLAMQIKTNYIANGDIGLATIVRNLRLLSKELSDMVNMFMNSEICDEQEERLSNVLGQIMLELNGAKSMSTFEFTESGVVKALLHYLFNGQYQKEKVDCVSSNNVHVVLKRFEWFAKCSVPLTSKHWENTPLAVLIQKLLNSLASLEKFPVILNDSSNIRKMYPGVPFGHNTRHPCFKVQFGKEDGETTACEYDTEIVTVAPFSSLDDIKRILWPKISKNHVECYSESTDKFISHSEDAQPLEPQDQDSLVKTRDTLNGLDMIQDCSELNSNFSPEEQTSSGRTNSASTSTFASTSKDYMEDGGNEDARKLIFFLDGIQLNPSLTLYQSIVQQYMKEEHDVIEVSTFWNKIYTITYRKYVEHKLSSGDFRHGCQVDSGRSCPEQFFLNGLDLSSMMVPNSAWHLLNSSPACEILFLLKLLENLNRAAFHLMLHEGQNAFAGDDLVFALCRIPQTEFVSYKLTEKLRQQMKDPLAVSTGCMPSWCGQLITEVPFLFSFETRCQYFHMILNSSSKVHKLSLPQSTNSSDAANHRQSHTSSLPRKKFVVGRSRLLDSASPIFDHFASTEAVLEIEFFGEVGTGLGPTMEFYTLVSHKFQMVGLGIWREDHVFSSSGKGFEVNDSGSVVAPHGLFPRPWSPVSSTSCGIQFSEVIKKYELLGKIIAKALHDRRILDLPLAKAFYKLILEKALCIYDIQSFDLGLGRALLEFQAIVDRKRNYDSASGESTTSVTDLCFQNTRIEDLCLDFHLPGYPDYELDFGRGHEMVTISNLGEYVSLMVEATIGSGILRQVEAFKSGFNQVFPIKNLQIFTEEELEHMLCGELNAWALNDLLEHFKFDHGYTANSPPIIAFLEIIQDFTSSQQRAFLQFVTGAPRLPPGGFAALSPKLTVVRKHCNEPVDRELPSVMTCTNYLKLPPYSSKVIMKERLLFAISEGQGSFHLS